VRRITEDEPNGVVIHISMEISQGNTMCIYLYLKVAKTSFFFLYFSFFFYKLGEKESRLGPDQGGGG
jgi:hypothetical protein